MPAAGKKAKQAPANNAQGKPVSSKTASNAAQGFSSTTSTLTRPKATASPPVSSANATKKRSVTCAVCEQNIVDGKDQALFCEGVCQRWLHRYCAGVSVPHFKSVSASSEPFYCIGCFQATHSAELTSLKETISSMQTEIAELKENLKVMSTKCTCSHNRDKSSSDGEWKRVERGVHGGKGRGGKSGGVGRGWVRGGVCGEGRDGGISLGEGSAGSKSKDVQGISSASSQKKRPAEKVRVQGARRVWGTMKLTTPTSLRHVISKFCPGRSLQIKRKTICDQAGQILRWWFVLHAPEDVLTALDAVWEQIKLQTGWKLELCFKPDPNTLWELSK